MGPGSLLEIATPRRPPLRPLAGRTVRIADLAPEQREAMWRLFSRYYADVSPSRFQADLSGKQHVILLRDEQGALQGFSTLLVYRRRVAGRRLVAIFSGDTIVDEAYWGQRALQHAFGAYITRVKLRHPFTPVYWFLISKGYKTYLLLSRNFPERWPCPDRPTPAWERAILDSLGRERFGAAWDPERGIVRAQPASGRLREGVADIDSALLEAPDVRFFQERNPGHASGDELACLGRVDATLWLRYAWKQARRRVRLAFRVRPWPAS